MNIVPNNTTQPHTYTTRQPAQAHNTALQDNSTAQQKTQAYTTRPNTATKAAQEQPNTAPQHSHRHSTPTVQPNTATRAAQEDTRQPYQTNDSERTRNSKQQNELHQQSGRQSAATTDLINHNNHQLRITQLHHALRNDHPTTKKTCSHEEFTLHVTTKQRHNTAALYKPVQHKPVHYNPTQLSSTS
jgi:hypothetical protein